MKLKKKKKAKSQRGSGSHGWGARKKHQGSGHQGGVGMAGSGKRADHKKSMVIHLWGNKYFGKQGQTSKGTRRKKNKVINLGFIQKNIDSLTKRLSNKEGIINLEGYKILGDGEITTAIKIKAESVSTGAREKIEKAGGKVILPEVKEKKEEEK